MNRPNPTPQEESSIFAGVALIVLGLLVFVPSGLCTGYLVLGSIIAGLARPTGGDGALPFVALVIGGPFVIGSGVMIWLGIKQFVACSRKEKG